MREAELVYRVMPSEPSDAGTHIVRHALIGLRGAVTLSWIEWDDATSDHAVSMDARWLRDFGHPAFPLWSDLGYHSREPVEYAVKNDCDVIGSTCWYDGSVLNAAQLGKAWEKAGRDPDWIRKQLAEYYHYVFYDREESSEEQSHGS